MNTNIVELTTVCTSLQNDEWSVCTAGDKYRISEFIVCMKTILTKEGSLEI